LKDVEVDGAAVFRVADAETSAEITPAFQSSNLGAVPLQTSKSKKKQNLRRIVIGFAPG
jgi:hypothetical protein